MPKKNIVGDGSAETVHHHVWIISRFDPTEEMCVQKQPNECKQTRISEQEAVKRYEEWDNYYALEETTPTHQIVEKMKIAFKANRMQEVKELHLELRAIGHEVENRDDLNGKHYEPKELLPTPPRLDPRNHPFIFVIE